MPFLSFSFCAIKGFFFFFLLSLLPITLFHSFHFLPFYQLSTLPSLSLYLPIILISQIPPIFIPSSFFLSIPSFPIHHLFSSPQCYDRCPNLSLILLFSLSCSLTILCLYPFYLLPYNLISFFILLPCPSKVSYHPLHTSNIIIISSISPHHLSSIYT